MILQRGGFEIGVGAVISNQQVGGTPNVEVGTIP
jgi:hypothetical protein